MGKGERLFRRVTVLLAFFFNFMQFCLSDCTDQEKHQLHLLLKTLSTSMIYAAMVLQNGMYFFGCLTSKKSQQPVFDKFVLFCLVKKISVVKYKVLV